MELDLLLLRGVSGKIEAISERRVREFEFYYHHRCL